MTACRQQWNPRSLVQCIYHADYRFPPIGRNKKKGGQLLSAYRLIKRKMRWVRNMAMAVYYVWDCGDRWLFGIWTCCVKNLRVFQFPFATAKLTGEVLTKRQSGDNIFLSAITPPTGNARWTPKKIRKIPVVWMFSLQIWSTLPIQEINYDFANILAQTCYFCQSIICFPIPNVLPICQDITYY